MGKAMRRASLSVLMCGWGIPVWAQNPANWVHDPGDESSSLPIAAGIMFLVMLWFFGAKNGPGRTFAATYPWWTVLLVFAIPITAGFLFR